MSGVLWSSVIAVLGTLAGGVLAGGVQARVAGVARREAREDVLRTEVLSAFTALVSALADHRRAMWVLEHHRLSGADRAVVAEARATSPATRSAVTAPLVTVSILVPALADPANHAAKATYALRDAPDGDALAVLRLAALQASDHLVASASAFFAADVGPGAARGRLLPH